MENEIKQEQRQQLYEQTLIQCKEEYLEIEKQVKKLGKRINALRMAINSLAELTYSIDANAIRPADATVVTTKEDRLQYRIKK